MPPTRVGSIHHSAAPQVIQAGDASILVGTWRFSQERALLENVDYILPVRIDDTRVPGILATTGYVRYGSVTGPKIAELIIKKLGIIEDSTQRGAEGPSA